MNHNNPLGEIPKVLEMGTGVLPDFEGWQGGRGIPGVIVRDYRVHLESSRTPLTSP